MVSENDVKVIYCTGCNAQNDIDMNKVKDLKGAYFKCKGCYRYMFVAVE